MPINPLQLPGPLIVPQLDFSPLDRLGDAATDAIKQQRQAEALGGLARQLAGLDEPTPATAAPTTPMAAPTATPGVPRSPTPTYQRTPYSSAVGLMLDAAPPEIAKDISITSGLRTPERQAQLYDAAVKKYGSEEEARKWVAPPGSSQHEKGNAADLQFGSDAARQWAHDNAEKYGLTFPLANEPWHIETVGARSQQPQPGQPGQMTLGLRNNNPGYVPDGGVAKVLPGYKGAEGGFAAFETPDHGLNAMDALLTSYGRRGIKTGGELVRQLPGMNPDNADAYARFISPNGDPNATIDFSDPSQKRQLIGKMSIFANDMHGGMGMAAPAAPPSPGQMADAAGRMPAGLAKRVEALAAVGSPLATQAALGIISKYIGKQQYGFQMDPNGVLLRTNSDTGTAEPVYQSNKGTLTETGTNPLSGQKSYSIFNPSKGTLTPLNGSGQSDAGAAPNPDQLAAKITQLRDSGATQEQLMNEIPAGWRNYVSSILKSGAIPTNLGRNSQARSILMDYAHIIDPNFDETQLLERKTFAQGMGDTKNPASYGGQLQAAGTVVKHLGDAYDQLDEFAKGPLGTTNTLNVLNRGKSYVRDQMGDESFQDAVGHWDIVKKGIAGELERLLSGKGGAESSKQYWLDKLDFNNGPNKIRAALDEARSLMMGRVENVALAKGRAYGGQPDPISLFGPKEQKIMEQIKGGTFRAQQAAAPQQSAPAAPAAGQPQEGQRQQFKQGWGVFHNGQWVPENPGPRS
jgi:hypothetical protein